MNEHRIKGAALKIRGLIKEATGKLTGNTKLEVKGVVENAAGKMLNAVGKVEDKIKSTRT